MVGATAAALIVQESQQCGLVSLNFLHLCGRGFQEEAVLKGQPACLPLSPRLSLQPLTQACLENVCLQRWLLVARVVLVATRKDSLLSQSENTRPIWFVTYSNRLEAKFFFVFFFKPASQH